VVCLLHKACASATYSVDTLVRNILKSTISLAPTLSKVKFIFSQPMLTAPCNRAIVSWWVSTILEKPSLSHSQLENSSLWLKAVVFLRSLFMILQLSTPNLAKMRSLTASSASQFSHLLTIQLKMMLTSMDVNSYMIKLKSVDTITQTTTTTGGWETLFKSHLLKLLVFLSQI